MKWLTTIGAAVLLGTVAAAPAMVSPALAQPGGEAVAAASEAKAQAAAQQPRRARTRLRVQKVYPYRRYHSLYPVPYDIEYPGPNAKRECVARYVTEYRPSGTVIVPRMRCWWVRG